MVSKTVKDILLIVVTTVVTFIFMLALPAFSFFVFGGNEIAGVFDKLLFYFVLGAASLLTLIMLSVGEILASRSPAVYSKFGWLRGIIHDPEISPLYNTPLKSVLKASNLFKFGIIVFSIMGLFAVVTNTFFVGLPQTEFQVTETAQLVLATEPAATSETLFFAVILSLMLGALHWIVKKNKLGTAPYTAVALLIIAPLNGVIWMAYHALRYSGQEKSLFAVFTFGFAGALLTVLSGSILLWWLLHLFNNAFQKANILFGDESILLVTVAFLLVFIITVIVLAVRKKGLKTPEPVSLEGVPG